MFQFHILPRLVNDLINKSIMINCREIMEGDLEVIKLNEI